MSLRQWAKFETEIYGLNCWNFLLQTMAAHVPDWGRAVQRLHENSRVWTDDQAIRLHSAQQRRVDTCLHPSLILRKLPGDLHLHSYLVTPLYIMVRL